LVATTRSSATQTLLGDPVDQRSLSATDVVALFRKGRLDLGFDLAERLLVATEQLPVDGVVGDREREFIDVRDVDERGTLLLELAGEDAAFLESLAGGEVVGELHGDVEIGRRSGVVGDLRAEYDREGDVGITTDSGFERGQHRRTAVCRVHSRLNGVSGQKDSANQGSYQSRPN
jgi:hypothetical protein